jgi:hypothetical protein
VPTPSVTPQPTPLAIGDPLPGDSIAAASVINAYERALIAKDWAAAWNDLAPEEQAHWGSYDQFVADRAAYYMSVDGQFAAKPPRHDPAEIRQWVVPDNFPESPVYPATPNYDRAFLIEVDYPALATNNAGWEVLLTAPDSSGAWRIWQLR